MKKILMVVMVAFLGLSLIGISSANASEPCCPGTGTPGYWMNNPDAWPEGVNELPVGGETYSIAQVIAIIKAPVQGDKTFTMFAALAAAKLNVLSGCDAPCDECICNADQWLVANPLLSGVTANSDAWQCDGEELYECLDEYNNGLGGVPSRDDNDE